MNTDIRWRVYLRRPEPEPAQYLDTIYALDRDRALKAARCGRIGKPIDVIAEVTWTSLSEMERAVFLGTFVSPGEMAIEMAIDRRKQRMGRPGRMSLYQEFARMKRLKATAA